MRGLLVASALLASTSAPAAAKDAREAAALAPVMAFYRSFNEGFTASADWATEDWNHINPGGGRTQGRDVVLEEVRRVHRTFLKGVTESPVQSDVRFASRDVAVVTVTSVSSPYAMPGGATLEAERHIRTFVVVRRGHDWKVMQDHNTTIATLPPR